MTRSSRQRLDSVSVVIPTHDRPTKLNRLLRSLDELAAYPTEVIVVTDSNDDATRAVLERWRTMNHPYTAKWFKQAKARGPATSRNLGVASSENKIIAFIDDDCVADSQWLLGLTQPIRLRDDIAGAGGRVIPLKSGLISRCYSRYHILEPPPSLAYLVSANCCYRKDAMIEVGGFDEDLTSPGGEDVALSLKLANCGWKFEFVRDAIVQHDFREGLRDFSRTFQNYGSGCRVVADRYGVPQFRVGTLAFGGYGYFGSLSPSKISLKSLLHEAQITYVSARKEGVPSEAVAFPVLRTIQRLSYYVGWKRAGS